MEPGEDARTDGEIDFYKLDFKYYKAKRVPPDWSRVFDPRAASTVRRTVDIGPNEFGIKETLEVIDIESVDGLLFVPDAFTADGLHLWTHSCLFDYPRRPNVTNLESLPVSLTKQIDEGEIALNEDLRKKLRWATLGYHHDWDTKKYNMEHYSTFPPDLAKCAAIFAEKIANYEYRYKAEAAIVNYYPIGTTLAGHVDYSEVDQSAPLISMSFGCTCIFLIGGPTKFTHPTAIYLRHGDVVIMTGQSRLAYHGVPRVFEEKIPKFPNEPKDVKTVSANPPCEKGNLCEKYLRKNRININIRQVHKPDV